jgi:hypothetical protein
MLNFTVYYNFNAEDYPKSLVTAGTTPAFSCATTDYLYNIGKVQTGDPFMNDIKLYTYAMTAYGLGDMLNEKGLVRQVFEQGVSSSTAFANRLMNITSKALAAALNVHANGSAATNTTAATTGTVTKL